MSLKSKNTPILTGFVLLNLVIFLTFYGFSWGEFTRFSNGFTLQSPFFAVAVHLIVLVLCYFFPETIKNTLVYWRIKNPLPGTRAFSELAPKDVRISMDNLKNQFGTLPTDPLEQNRLWYRIYRSKEKDTVVTSSHSRWLLTRDITTIAFELLILLSVITFARSFALMSFVYSIFLVLQYLLFVIVARNNGNKFVCNVLAR